MSDALSMMDRGTPVIRVHNVSMAYKLYAKPVDLLKEAIFGGVRHDTFWAIRDISLCVYEGERLGIVGPNGAGKTTLLQVIAGNLKPNSGQVSVNGRISSLLSQAPAWNVEETGLQNVRFNLMVQGVPEERIPGLVEEIIDFTELGPFVFQPVKTYSSGMGARLLFAIATAVDPEILIVDEVLGAGDGYFAGKAAKRMQEFCARGRALLFVSHATAAVRMMCDTAIWVENGEIRARGPVDTVLQQYEAEILDRQDQALREGNRRRLATQQHVVTPDDLGAGASLRMRIRPLTGSPRITSNHYLRNIQVSLGETSREIPIDLHDLHDDTVEAALDIHTGEWGRIFERGGYLCRALLPRAAARGGGHMVMKWPKEATNQALPITVSFEVSTDGPDEPLTIDYVDIATVEWEPLDIISQEKINSAWARITLRGLIVSESRIISENHTNPESIPPDKDPEVSGVLLESPTAPVESDNGISSLLEAPPLTAQGHLEVNEACQLPASPSHTLPLQLALIKAEQLVRRPVAITGVALIVDGRPALSVKESQPFSILVTLMHHEAVPDVSVNLNITRADGAYVFYQPSGLENRNIKNFLGRSEVVFHFDPNPFGFGQYEVSVFAANGFSWENIPPSDVYDRSLSNLIFNVHLERPICFGLINVIVPVTINLTPNVMD